MALETMEELFWEQIQDLYDAEQRLVKALPKMAAASTSQELRNAFEDHLDQTRGHATRLEQIFQQMDKDPKATSCDAMKGLIKEGETMISDTEQSPLRDAGLIACANRVEHYEIAAYGTVRTLAETLGFKKAAILLEQTLQEEEAADEKLTQLAEGKVNAEAMRSSGATQYR